MKTPSSKSWPLRLITLTVWMVAVLCGAYWALKFVTVKPLGATPAATAPAVVVDSLAVAKLLGATHSIAGQAINMPASANFALYGLAMTGSGAGLALIATDGKPAKPYRVGSKVDENWVLKSVSRTGVVLAASVNAPDGMKLELPARRPASMVVSAPLATPSQIVQALPTAAPGIITPQAGGLGSAMGNLTNAPMTTGQNPAQVATPPPLQRPVSRYAPLQGEQGASGRVPLLPPSATSAVTVPATPKP